MLYLEMNNSQGRNQRATERQASLKVSHVCHRVTHGDCLALIALRHRRVIHKHARHMQYGQANPRWTSFKTVLGIEGVRQVADKQAQPATLVTISHL
jgi:hypothetical protein